MTGMKDKRIAVYTGLLLCLFLCPLPSVAGNVQAVVSVPPLAWLIDEIGGDTVDVEILVPEGHVPESSQPAPRSMVRLRTAQIIILVGHPSFTFETRFVKPQLSGEQVSASINLYELAVSAYSPAEINAVDPHLWTSPHTIRAAIRRVAEQLSRLDPRYAGVYAERADRLSGRVDALADRFQAMADQRPSKQFVVYHPAWGSLARDFGLQQLAIEHEGKSPGPARLARLLDDIAKMENSVIITSPGHAQRDAAVIARQHNVRIEVVDPLMRDWLGMMQHIMTVLADRESNG